MAPLSVCRADNECPKLDFLLGRMLQKSGLLGCGLLEGTSNNSNSPVGAVFFRHSVVSKNAMKLHFTAFSLPRTDEKILAHTGKAS
ncbi:MAG: hypothetical protein FWF59_09430 [Turicibacter sp.]|nr:hypothetical protein [Turicibacter sp.]